jgi:predicted nucleotidyltransferase component of viral defense system
MISKEELEKYKKMKGLDLGQTEKDYLLELTLMVISRETKNELVFKGGTCLYKFHNLNRFSEDLDFSAVREIDKDALFDKIINGLKDFGIKSKIKTITEPYNSILTKFNLEGPLYDGRPITKASIRVDINTKSEVLMPQKNETMYSSYREITPFQVLCMDVVEIAAEKIRTIMSRNKARDIYDLWFLLKKGIEIDRELLDKKLEYYNLVFDKKQFEEKLDEKKAEWKEDLARFVFGPLPEFKQVRADIIMRV